MAVKYTLSFSSDTGNSREWELDILDEGFTGTATKLKGQASPIEIEWKRDRDPYAPIVGSRATINLLLENGDVIDDFNSGTEFQYEVRLRYKDDDDNLQDYWKGWINPNDGDEKQGSYPLHVSYVATDGFGKLNYNVRKPEDRGQVLLLHYILDALEQTGLGLDVYIDSSIRDENDADALTTVKVNELAFIEEDKSMNYGDQGFNADNVRDALEGILRAFNCVVKQSKGRFYIYNASLHTEHDKTWSVYEYKSADDDNKVDGTNYIPGTSVTETVANLTKELASSDTDLFIQDETLHFLPRYPYGSVEATPVKLRKVDPVTNANFDNGSEGWEVHTDSVVQTLSIGTQSGEDFANAGNVIKNTRNVNKKSISSTDDVWFQTDSTYAQKISTKFPLDFSFDYYAEFENNGDISNTKRMILRYALWVEFEADATTTTLSNNGSLYPPDWTPTTTMTTASYTANKFFYNFSTNTWSPVIAGEPGLLTNSYGVIDTTEDGTWETVNERIASLSGGTSFYGYSYWEFPDEQPKVYVRFFYPDVRNGSNGSRSTADSGKIEVWFDNISLLPDFGDNPKPVFERVRPLVNEGVPYVGTLKYEPGVIGNSALDQQYYELLDTSEYWEEGDDVDSDDSRVLEEIVTNQKLNDWKDQFYSWEATLINNSEHPLTPIDIINVDTSVTGSNLSTDYLSIVQAGVFDPKTNSFNLSMYSPNQTSSDYGKFYEHNVNLRASKPPVRDREITYTLAYFLTANDDDDNEVSNGLLADRYWVQIHGKPGDVINETFIIHPKEGYEIDGSLELEDSDTNPAPDFSTLSFERVGSQVVVTVNLTMPEEDEYEEAHINGTVDELVGNNSKVIFSATDSMTNASVTTTAVTELGPVGATEKYYFYVVPDSTYEMKTSALTVTLNSVKDGNNSTDTDVSGVITSSDIREIQSGTGVIVEVPFKYSDTTPVYAKLTFSGTATTVPDIDTVTMQVKVTEAGSDTSNWSITDADITQTCVPGTPLLFPFEINPESGRAIPQGNISMGSIEEAALGSYHVTGTGVQNAEATVWLEATCPTSNTVANVTINATTTAGTSGENLNSYGITWTAPSNTTINNSGSGQTLELEEGQTAQFILSVEANTGYDLNTVAINTSSLPTGLTYDGATFYGDGSAKELADFRFIVTGQSSDDTGNAIPFSGSTADALDLQTLLININTDDDSINADTDKKQIRIPWSLADKNEAITSETFKIYSSETTKMYNATGDVSFTVTSASDNDASLACTASSITNGVITATITGNLPNETIPEDGIAEVDITVAGPADTTVPATSTNSTLTRSDNFGDININGGYCYFDVESDGPWELYAWDGFGSDGKMYTLSRNSGTDGKYTGIRFDYTNEFTTKTGSISTYVYLMKPGLFTDAQRQIIQDRDGTSTERSAISTIFTTSANQLASRVQISMKSTATQQPGFAAQQIEIVSTLPASPSANKVYIVTG